MGCDLHKAIELFAELAFPCSPQQMRQIEHDCLREQHERDPLVVRVERHLVFGLPRADAGVRQRVLPEHRFVVVARLQRVEVRAEREVEAIAGHLPP